VSRLKVYLSYERCYMRNTRESSIQSKYRDDEYLLPLGSCSLRICCRRSQETNETRVFQLLAFVFLDFVSQEARASLSLIADHDAKYRYRAISLRCLRSEWKLRQARCIFYPRYDATTIVADRLSSTIAQVDQQ